MPDWQQGFPSGAPSGRLDAAAAYDPALGATILFGGQNATGSGFLSDTYAYFGAKCTTTQASCAGYWLSYPNALGSGNAPQNLTAREYANMFYDATLKTVVLFGGLTPNGVTNTVYAFVNGVWTQVTMSGTPPSARYSSVVSQFGTGSSEVLFSGYSDSSDTFVFTGSASCTCGTWSAGAGNGPHARAFATMTWDPVRQVAVLFGGSYVTSGNTTTLGDTWTYGANGWTQMVATAPAGYSNPPGRYAAMQAFDSSAGQTVLFGGINSGGTYVNGTWRWDGTTWSPAYGIATPPATALATTTYDPVYQELILADGETTTISSGVYLASHSTPTLTVTSPTPNSTGDLSRGSVAVFTVDVGNPSAQPIYLPSVRDELPPGMSATGVTVTLNGGGACTTVTSPACTVDGRDVTMGAVTLGQNSDDVFTVTGVVTGAVEGPGTTTNACSTTGSYTPAVAGSDLYRDTLVNDTTYKPLAYYRFEETSGSSAVDSSGHGYSATYSGGGVTLGAAGAPIGDTASHGITLNGTSGAVTLPAAQIGTLPSNGLTYEVWANPTGGSTGANGTLLDLSASTTAQTSAIWLHRVGTTNGVQLEFDNTSGTPAVMVPDALIPNTANPAAGWQLLQVRITPHPGSTTQSDVEIDRNGAALANVTLANPDNVARPYAALGATPTGNYYAGGLDEAVLYQPGVTVPGHYELASSGTAGADVASVTSPVGDYYRNVVSADGAFIYRLNESSGSTAMETGGYYGTGHYNASYEGSIGYGAAGPLNNDPETGVTLTSSGTSDVNLATAGSWGAATFSIEAWVKPTAGSAVGDIVALGNTNAANSLEIVENPSNGNLTWSSNGGTNGTSNGNLTASGALTNGVWQQVDATIDASGNVNLYVNGAHVGTQTQVPALNATARTSDYIGRWVTTNPLLQYTGAIADVSLTAAVWTATQVGYHYYTATSSPAYGVTRTLTAPQPVCDTGLGVENWWTYDTLPVGDTSTAKVNVSNGNLVVEATDGTPVTTHGRLGYVLRRFYNSEETNTLTSPTALGKGWQMATGQTDDLTDGLTSGAGLAVPAADTVAHPLALTLIDRDGTHHTYDPNQATADTPFGYLHAPAASALVAGIPALLSGGGLAKELTTLATSGVTAWACSDQTYTPPPGVHLSLWRYLGFTAPTGQSGNGTCSTGEATASGVKSVILGWVAERPDRLRDEYGPTGQLTDQIDPAGVDQRYIYDNSLTTGTGSIANPGLPATSGRLRDIYEPASCGTQVVSGSGSYALPASCRALQFSYSDDSGITTTKTCAKITSPNLTACALDTAGRTTSYGLDGTSLSGSHLTTVQDPDGKTTLYTYGTSCGGTADQLCAVTDRAGNRTSFAYIPATDTTRGFGSQATGFPNVLTQITDRRGYTTLLGYGGGAGTGTTVDRPASAGATTCSGTGGCERTQFSGIDRAGRVTLAQAGSYNGTTFTALTQTLYAWDAAGNTCRTDGTVDNDLCSATTNGNQTTPVNPPAGYTVTPNETTSWTYASQGETLSQTKTLAGGNLVTTWGYREEQIHTDGTVSCTSWTPTGNGTPPTASADTTDPGCATGSAAPVLYTLSDKTAMITPRGNAAGSSYAAYETSYRTDDLASSGTNAVPAGANSTGGVCSANGAATANTGVLCETDTPASAGNSIPQGYCQASQAGTIANYACTLMTYDSYGQKVTMASPLAIATATNSTTIPVTAYVYGQDSDRDLTGTVTAGGWLKAVADPTAGATNGSPAATALTGHFVAFGYDTAGNTARTWDRNSTTATADALSSYPGTVVSPPAGNPPYTQTLRAALGSITASLTTPWRYVRSSTDPLGDVTNTCVNANGDPTVVRSPRGSNGTLMADSDCAAATAALGAPSGAYDVRDTYDSNDEELASVEPLGATGSTPPNTNSCLSPGNGSRYACVSYSYDAYGNRVLTVHPDDAATTPPYDHAAATAYDAVNRPTGTLADRDDSGSGTQASTGCPLVSSYTSGVVSTLTTYFANTDTACATGATYDGLGDTVSSTDGTGATTWSEYDGVTRKISTWAPRYDTVFTGTLRTDIVYDQDGDVTATCPPREFDTQNVNGQSASIGEPVASTHVGESGATGMCSSAAPGPFSTATVYDLADHATSTTRHRSSLALITTNAYDADGNTVSTTDPNGNTTNDISGNTTTHTYNVLDRKTSTTVPRSDSLAETTSYGYDAAGDTLYTDAPGTGSARRRTLSTYDADNRTVDTIIGADSDSVSLIGAPSAANQVNLRSRNYYDADGHLIAAIDPRAMDGHTTGGTTYTSTNPDFSYLDYNDVDVDGRTTATYTPRTSGSTGVAPDPGIDTTQGQQCTTAKRPASVVSAPGMTAPTYPASVTVCMTGTTYDANGNHATTVMATSTGADNRYTATSFTDDDLAATVSSPAPPGPNAGQRVTTSTVYDGDGRSLVGTDQVGRQSSSTYNEDGTQSSQTLPRNGSMTDTTTTQYDAGGEAVSVTNALNQISSTHYNSDGTTADSIDASGDDTRYTYDSNGNATQILHPDGTYSLAHPGSPNAANPNADPVMQTYTADNLLLSTASATTPNATAASGAWRHNDYTYDDGGRTLSTHTYVSNSAASTTPLSGQDAGTQTFSYYPTDLTNTQMARSTGGATCQNTECITSTYDAAGNTMTTSDGTGGSPQTVSDTYYLDSTLTSTTDGTRIQTYSYDGASTETARSDGPMSQSPTITSYTLGDDESAQSIVDPVVSMNPTTVSYNKDGEESSQTNPNSTVQSDKYAQDGTLNSQVLMNGTTVVASQTYSYDALKRVASQAEAGSTPNMDTSNYCYGYDPAGRLNGYQTTTSSCGTTPTNIAYDPDGNRTLNYDGTATSDNPDDSIATQGSATYSYTPAGGVNNDGTGAYAYDGFDRLTTAMSSGASSCTLAASCVNYTYDGLDRQTSHTNMKAIDGRAPAGTTVTQSFDGLSNAVADETPSGMTATSYDLTPGDTPLAAGDGVPTDMTVLTDDGRGSTATGMTTAGQTCAIRYDPFGKPVNTTAATGSPCQTGSTSPTTINDLDYHQNKRDTATGDYQLGSRTYNPSSASYLTPDTYRAGSSNSNASIGTDPLTSDTYSYVNGDPLNLTDADGHQGVCGTPNPAECGPTIALNNGDFLYTGKGTQLTYSEALHNAHVRNGLRQQQAAQIVSALEVGDADYQDIGEYCQYSPYLGQVDNPDKCQSAELFQNYIQSLQQSKAAGIQLDPFDTAVYQTYGEGDPGRVTPDDGPIDFVATIFASIITDGLAGVLAGGVEEGATSAAAQIAINRVAGNAARDGLAFDLGTTTVEQFRPVAGTGGRFIDVLDGADAYEVKTGYTTLTQFIRTQIAKDAILLESRVIRSCTWIFDVSAITGKQGASKALLDLLQENGIAVASRVRP